MDGVRIIESSTRTPATTVSSGSHPVATTANLRASAEELFSTAAAVSMTKIGADRSGLSRRRSTRARAPQWARVRDALSVEGMAATRSGRAPAPADQPGAASDAAEGAETSGAVRVEAANVGDRFEAVSESPPPKSGSAPSRVELTIDSLRTYELVKPIPVFVEALGERHYVAEVPDLDMNISASSLGETLIVLKNSIVQAYDELRIRRSLDTEQVRQLRTLETYIGKPKRSWLDRR